MNNAVMSGDASDLRLAGTERSVVAAQYQDPANLQSRVNVYAYLCPEHPLPRGVTFEDWVLDHLDWTGEESALDIGCGPGGFLSPISLRARRVMGFDLSLGMLARARKAAPDGQTHLAADPRSYERTWGQDRDQASMARSRSSHHWPHIHCPPLVGQLQPRQRSNCAQ